MVFNYMVISTLSAKKKLKKKSLFYEKLPKKSDFIGKNSLFNILTT